MLCLLSLKPILLLKREKYYSPIDIESTLAIINVKSSPRNNVLEIFFPEFSASLYGQVDRKYEQV